MSNDQVLAIIEQLGEGFGCSITILHHKGIITTEQAVELLGLYDA